jgi:amino-acid N-acetyltransferase
LVSTTDSIPARGAVSFGVRKALLADIPDILVLINSHAARGIMLPRTEFEMAENIRDFSVIHHEGRVVGCGALHFYTPRAAEIRSLAIAPEYQGGGGGKVLMHALEAEAQAFGLQDVFAFTYIPDFFSKLGFTAIDRGELPLKAWKDCLRCPKFQCCDEIAVIKHLGANSSGVMNTHISGVDRSTPEAPDLAIPVPVLRNRR